MPQNGSKRCAIGDVTQHFVPGHIDDYTPLPLGNGDIGGLFDPFGGTFYDELSFGTGAQRDIRTLLLTRLVSLDYWCLDGRDADWHHFDPGWFWQADPPEHYFAPTAPFTVRLGPAEVDFLKRAEEHCQVLSLRDATLRSTFRFDGHGVSVECWIQPQQSLLVCRLETPVELVFELHEAPTPVRPKPYRALPCNPDHLRVRDGYFETHMEGDMLVGEAMSNVQCPCHFAAAASGGRWSGSTLRLPPGRHEIYAAVGHQSLTDPRDRAESVRRQAREARLRGYARLRSQHRRWWHRFWSRTFVELPDKRIEAMWYRSLYYLACFVPRRVPAFNLEGAYADFPAFAGGHPQDTAFHLWAAISSGHPELCEATLRLLIDALPVAQATARHAYFARGARYPWQATPGLLPYLEGHRNPPFMEHHQNACLVEAARRYLESYGWPRGLTRKLYPVVKSIAEFWSSILTPRGESFEIRFVPTLSQNEHWDSRDRPNVIDMLLSAKWSLQVAAEIADKLGVDQDWARQARDESQRIGLQFAKLPDGSYGIHERHTDIDGKVPAQLAGVVMAPVLLQHDAEGLRKTFARVRRTIDYRACGWAPGYYAIAAARMRDAEMALECLEEAFTFSREPWIMLRENMPYGRMPYYLAGHALFVQGLNEMLVQSLSGRTEILPACPFDEVEFRLPARDRMITVCMSGGRSEVIEDQAANYRRPRLA